MKLMPFYAPYFSSVPRSLSVWCSVLIVMRELMSLFTGGTLIGLIVIAAALLVVGVILWWNRRID